MIYDAIVLLGYSGVGKDTTFAALDARHPGTYTNAKFGALAKQLTAIIYDCPPKALENKDFRTQTRRFGLTPLDVLTVLYKGCTPELTEAHVNYCLVNIEPELIPVFTDVRRMQEAKAVESHYSRPLFVYLWSSNVSEGINDGEVEAIAMMYSTHRINRSGKTVTDVVNELEELISCGF